VLLYFKSAYAPWQLPLLAVFLFGWLLGGGYLLHRYLRGALPRRGATMGRCVLASLLAGGAVLIAAGAVFVLFGKIGERAEMDLRIVGGALGIIGGVPMWFLVLYVMFPLPIVRIVRVGSPAAGGVLLLALVVGAGVILPARALNLREVRKLQSINRLQMIHDLIHRNFDLIEASLEQPLATVRDPLGELARKKLAGKRILSPSQLRSPCDPQREIGYFYRLARSLPRDERTPELQACEFSHAGSDAGRVVLFRNGYCDWVPASEFERLLSLEENKEFAAAFREADKK